jgi:hypothetical protein
MTNPKHEEARLIRRVIHLRTLLHYVEDALIFVTLKEFIAETETQLVMLRTDRADIEERPLPDARRPVSGRSQG